MAKSFVLRDKTGRMGGYVLIRQGEIRCRLSDDYQEAVLSVILQDGTVKTYHEAWGKEETTVKDTAVGEADGAGLTIGGRCVLASGNKAADLLQIAKRDAAPVFQHAQSQWPELNEYGDMARNKCNENVNRWPQIRWPAPVLMMRPVYQNGEWTEEE